MSSSSILLSMAQDLGLCLALARIHLLFEQPIHLMHNSQRTALFFAFKSFILLMGWAGGKPPLYENTSILHGSCMSILVSQRSYLKTLTQTSEESCFIHSWLLNQYNVLLLRTLLLKARVQEILPAGSEC